MEPHDALATLVAGQTLSAEQAEALFERLLSGGMDDAQIAGVLSLIQARGATVPEVIGAARVMRRHVTPTPAPNVPGATLTDTCGTGGAPKTFNISTAAAIVAAAARPGGGRRALVAKHGNRSRTGRGSAEALAALGVRVDATPEVQSRCLTEAGVCFCFAIHHHPAMRHAVGPRRSLGFPTIFNLLGPLTNPAGARRQVIGVYEARLVPLIAEALAGLGAERAIVAHGRDGMDELTTTAPTLMAFVSGRCVRVEELDSRTLGLAPARLDDLRVASVEEAAGAVRAVLAGEPGPRRDVTLLNAAAALLVADAAASLAEGLAQAAEAVDSGRARETLETLVQVSGE
ncbi:MAG: anthranilate phosphoribosyltransferase [Phycisphaeraceae bacterium]|nr:anthranilate phosphoribosyltransferase [Phycisphaeraceae bacterium]